MLAAVAKLLFSFSSLIFVVVVLCQTLAIGDISPTSPDNGNYQLQVKHPLGADLSLVQSSPLLSKIRRFKTKSSFSSPRAMNKRIRRPMKKLQTLVDDRLKRFRMLDPDEFQEMLNSFNHQISYEPSKSFNHFDTIDGMQLENYWSRK